MSRVAKKPVALPKGVECTVAKDTITVKVAEVDGNKKLDFELSSGASGAGELVSAGSPSKN